MREILALTFFAVSCTKAGASAARNTAIECPVGSVARSATGNLPNVSSYASGVDPDQPAISVSQYWCEAASGIMHGPYLIFTPEGNKLFEGHFANGKQDGVMSTWNLGGWKMLDVSYVEGIEDGASIAYFPNGRVKHRAAFKAGIRVGTSTGFYESGQKSIEGQFANDKMTGVWLAWHENGAKKSRGERYGDQKRGEWTEWDEKGRVTCRAVYSETGQEISCTGTDCSCVRPPRADDSKQRQAIEEDLKKGLKVLEPNAYQVARRAADSVIAGFLVWYSAARLEPSFEDGRLQGFQILEITSGSVLDLLGFITKDVVLAINGQPVTSPTHVGESLKGANDIEIEVERAGQRQTLRYKVQ